MSMILSDLIRRIAESIGKFDSSGLINTYCHRHMIRDLQCSPMLNQRKQSFDAAASITRV